MNLERRGRKGMPERNWSETDLKLAWRTQAQSLLNLGIHSELGYPSEEEYLASLPKFSSKPEELAGRFDVPLLLETRVPFARLAELSGVKLGLTVPDSGITDWPGNRFRTPNNPYTVWVGTKDTDTMIPEPNFSEIDVEGRLPEETISAILEHVNDTRNSKSIPVIRKYLKGDERGATVLEGLHYFIYNQEVLEYDPDVIGACFFMVGSQEFDHHGRELRLYLGRYLGSEIYITDNGDPADANFSQAVPLVIGLPLGE